MQAGNAHYRLPSDLPTVVAVFPLSGALLLPGGRMPLNIFEPRYLQMVDEVMSGTRLIGMVQPALDGSMRGDGEPEICEVVKTPFRQCRIMPFLADLKEDPAAGEVNRPALLKAFRAYLQANDLEADWDSVSRAENAMLVNALSMMAPYGAAEKQALLEEPDLKTRADTLIAITEMALAREDNEFGSSLQ